MVETVRHRQTKEAGTDMFEPKATAPHLDSTATGHQAFENTSFSGAFCWTYSGSKSDSI
jgi:hypothetical protein